jgi:ribonuclease VapC
MILETSALVAILVGEPARARLLKVLVGAERVRMSAASYLEAAIVVDRLRDPVLSRHLDTLLEKLRVEVVPVDLDQARTARGAYRDFGKGSGHPAGLNLGDCFGYALAHETNDELLYVGDDFSHTDVRQAAAVGV